MPVCPVADVPLATEVDDLCLLTAVRLGDMRAYAELYTRHVDAARGLARHLAASTGEAEDVVSESFAKVLERLQVGKGPHERFRPYLLRTVRNDVYDRARRAARVRPSDDLEKLAGAVSLVDPADQDLEWELLGKAYASLPDRWRRTLWHTAVEGRSPHEVARLLGSTATNVTSIACRARERLRRAYLERYLAAHVGTSCEEQARRLPAFVRGDLGRRATVAVTEHLRSCVACRSLVAKESA